MAHPREWVQPWQASPADTRTPHASPAIAVAARIEVSPASAVPTSSLRWPFSGSSTRSCGSGPCQALSVRRASLWMNFKLCYEDCFVGHVWHTICLKAEKAQGYLHEQCLKNQSSGLNVRPEAVPWGEDTFALVTSSPCPARSLRVVGHEAHVLLCILAGSRISFRISLDVVAKNQRQRLSLIGLCRKLDFLHKRRRWGDSFTFPRFRHMALSTRGTEEGGMVGESRERAGYRGWSALHNWAAAMEVWAAALGWWGFHDNFMLWPVSQLLLVCLRRLGVLWRGSGETQPWGTPWRMKTSSYQTCRGATSWHAWTLVHCLSISSSSSSSRGPHGPGASFPQPCMLCFPQAFPAGWEAAAGSAGSAGDMHPALGWLSQALQLTTLCFSVAALCPPWLIICQSQPHHTLEHPSVSSAAPGSLRLPRWTDTEGWTMAPDQLAACP